MSVYAGSPEAAFRRFVRQSIRKAPITRSDRDILTSLANFWFHHEGNGRGYIHPGREKLAARARVSIVTVARCLQKLRDAGVIAIVSHPNGGWGTATRYKVNITQLLRFCGHKFPDEMAGELASISTSNDTHFGGKMIHTLGIKMIHGYNTVQHGVSQTPIQGLKSSVGGATLRLIEGGVK